MLMELANIQSRSLEMMAGSQKSQQEAFQELTRASKDKWNDTMFASIKVFEQTGFWRLDRRNWPSLQSKWSGFQNWDLQEVHRSCVTSSTILWWAHRQQTNCKIMKLLLSCTHNEWSQRGVEEHETTRTWICICIHVQMGKGSLQIIRNPAWKWETSPCHQRLYIIPEEKYQEQNHQQMGRNETATKHCPESFQTGKQCRKQLQVADSLKLEFPSYPTAKVNELSTEESSGNEVEINKISRSKKWENNNDNYKQKCSNFSSNHTFGNKPQCTKPQDNKQGKQWDQKSKDSKITLTQESAHYIPTEFSSSFFRQFDLAMKLKWEELEETGKKQQSGKWDHWRWSDPGLWHKQRTKWRKLQQYWAGVKRPKSREIHQPD